MPYLDQLFQKQGLRAYGEPQCFDGKVVAIDPDVLVVLPNFDPHLRWGPCKGATAQVQVGDEVAALISEAGTVWLLGTR
jgi:hypothetical protein